MLPPAGEAYDWYRRGTALLEQGNAAAAAELLAWAARAEPEAASIREAWARALFDAGRFAEGREFETTRASASGWRSGGCGSSRRRPSTSRWPR